MSIVVASRVLALKRCEFFFDFIIGSVFYISVVIRRLFFFFCSYPETDVACVGLEFRVVLVE